MKTGEQQANTEDYVSLDGVILIDEDMEIWYAKVKYVSEKNNDEINKKTVLFTWFSKGQPMK